MAQGAARGSRTSLAGGIGILRDDEGNDVYEAEMFAQGMGFYYGVGLLWDRAGDDRYRAVRYAQGNGVHEAAGILRDDSGNDRYELTFASCRAWASTSRWAVYSGRQRRSLPSQSCAGAVPANFVGILIDGGGADDGTWVPIGVVGAGRWRRNAHARVALYDRPRSFVREGKPCRTAVDCVFGGPLGRRPSA